MTRPATQKSGSVESSESVGVEAGALAGRPDGGEDGAMAEHDALRAAGGAGGVEDAGDRLGIDVRLRRARLRRARRAALAEPRAASTAAEAPRRSRSRGGGPGSAPSSVDEVVRAQPRLQHEQRRRRRARGSRRARAR